MAYEQYEPVIGLEVHCQLLTEAKAFSPEPAAYGAAPNTHVDPVSLGHPGTLPVLNERVVESALRLGLATRCRIAERAVFARKHYFYPDLPKGYQISQYDTPLCYDGFVEVLLENEGASSGDGHAPDRQMKRIRLRRIHLEEDAGKSVHDADPTATLLDYNRCGVPLVEVVTEPDLRAPHEAYLFLQTVRQLVRYLRICDGNMEEGSLRCDANVSVRPRGRDALGTKTELKNMNSLKSVERALEYEIARQMALLERGEAVTHETRLWDADAHETRPMRAKEEAHDYRYFPDPDLAPITVTEERLKEIQADLPEMPAARRARFQEDLGLPPYDAGVLTEERAVADYFEATLDALFKHTKGGNTRRQAKAASNVIMTDVLRAVKERAVEMERFPIEPERLAALVYLRLKDDISSSGAQEVFEAMLDSEKAPEEIAKERNLMQVSDAGALEPVIENVLQTHDKNVRKYLDGKKGLIGFFIGQVMADFDGAPDPKLVRKLLREKLDAMRS